MSPTQERSLDQEEITSVVQLETGVTLGATPELRLLMAAGAATPMLRRELSAGQLHIGRDVPSEDLRVADPSLSRCHARFVCSPTAGSVELVDCDSRNGSFVNGHRVRRAVLDDGDIIRTGETLWLYTTEQPMQQVLEQTRLSARSGLSVLLRGETGTGKEVLARQIHDRSGRDGRFVALNCASLPRDLILAELFGHAKGAFSGALHRRSGMFLAAQRGTLLLDEIGDCALDVQAALLRALQERAIRPLGEEHEVAVDLQVIAATHCDLEAAIEARAFRADLYARLAQSVIRLPPLRERRAEILPLLQGFAREHECEASVSPDAAEALLLWDYPFNIRELQNLARLFATSHAPRGRLDLRYLRQAHPELARGLELRRNTQLEAAAAPACTAVPQWQRRQQLKALLQQHQGNVSRVAEVLGKPRAQIYRWLRVHGLSVEAFRNDSRTVARLVDVRREAAE